jgi:multidrug efflux pump subunit AcrA (membrane-fusion protein)
MVGMNALGGQREGGVVATPTPAPPPLTARGRVEPIQQARIGTLGGGVIARLVVEPGTVVGETQEIARVRGASGVVEVLTAPWAGTITAVPVRLGDTVMPGAIVASIADLRALQVETTDVDEFIVSRLRVGQRARVTIDALDQRELIGHIVSLTLQPRRDESGDLVYPTTIALAEVTPDVRPGMSVRLRFEE